MPDITTRRVGELQRGVIKILLDLPDGLPAKDVLSRLEQVVPPTEFEKSDYPKHPGIRRFEKMARFATIGPVKAGWLVKSKGRWYLTEEGIKAYNQIKDPEEFNREVRRLYLKWRTTQPEAIAELEAGGLREQAQSKTRLKLVRSKKRRRQLGKRSNNTSRP